MITIKDIADKTMTPEKREEAKHSIFAFYIGRPISYVVTVPLLYMDISPNFITVVSIVFALGGFVVLSVARTSEYRIAGLFLFFLWNIFDGVDGNIARYKNLKSKSGDMLDTLGGYLALSLILLSMGNAAYQDVDDILAINKIIPVFASGLSVIFALIPRLLMHRDLALHPENKKSENLKDKTSYGLIRLLVLNLCDPAGFQWVITVIAVVFHLCSVFTFGYAFCNFVIMVYSLRQLIRS